MRQLEEKFNQNKKAFTKSLKGKTLISSSSPQSIDQFLQELDSCVVALLLRDAELLEDTHENADESFG